MGIDASNLRGGGGVTHLVELLQAACPQEHGIEEIIVWGGQSTLAKIQAKPWLLPVQESILERSLPERQYWQRVILPALALKSCDVLFAPGGILHTSTRPAITMCRNMLPFENREAARYGRSAMRIKLWLLKQSQSKSFRQADGVIFLTGYAQNVVRNQLGPLGGQQTVIPHGINDRFRCEPRIQRSPEEYSWEKPLRLLYVSIITVYKHQWRVAEAVVRLRQSGLPVTLDLIGPAYGPALDHLRSTLRRLDPTGSAVRYLGPIDHGCLRTYYHQAESFVYASSCENMPNILVEAMAAGLPIACSNRGPMPEVLGSAGVYFDPEQSDSISDALQRLMEDVGQRTHLAQMAYERAEQFSWRRCAQSTLDFIVRTANDSILGTVGE